MLSFFCEVIARPLVVSLVAKPDKPAASLPDGQHDDDLDDSDSEEDSDDDDDDGNVADELNRVEHVSVWDETLLGLSIGVF